LLFPPFVLVVIFLVVSQCDVTVAASEVNPHNRDPRLAADSIQQIRHAVVLMDHRVAALVHLSVGTQVGDTPERILLSRIALSSNWHGWRAA
jgi:hypothetical protein